MKFIAFDLETTGVIAGVDQIVEIGAVKFEDGEVVSFYSTLVNPRRSIPEGASRVNGIFDEMVSDKPFIEDLLASFADFCGEDPLVAHNAAFDTQFLVEDIKKHQAPAPRGLILDTYPMAKKIFPGLANYKLGTLVQHLEIPSSTFHRAEADATYCGRLFIKMLEKINGVGSLFNQDQLVALTGKAPQFFPQIKPEPRQLTFF